MREKPKDNTRLRHMLEAINNIIEFTTDVTFEEYSRNKILRFAVIKNLEIVGEAAYLSCFQWLKVTKMKANHNCNRIEPKRREAVSNGPKLLK